MGWDVFISYAGEDTDKYLLRFVDELTVALKGRTLTVFFDEDAIHRGDLWKEELMEGLDTAKVVIPLLSPQFFASPWCARELAYFHSRNPPPALIKPILWIPLTSPAPEPLGETQSRSGDKTSVLNRDGLLEVRQNYGRYKSIYLDFKKVLVNEIIGDICRYSLPAMAKRPKLDELRPYFVPNKTPFAAAPQVRFIYAAASPGEFGDARTREPYLLAGGPDWKPFFPDDRIPIHDLLELIVHKDEELRLSSAELPFNDTLSASIEEAWARREVVVLIVDGWSVQWSDQYRRALKALDSGLTDFHWCVLIPRNEKDPDFVANRAAIDAALADVFSGHVRLGNPVFFRDNIKSSSDLRAAVKEAVIRLRAQIRERATVEVSVPTGPARSVLSSAANP